MAKELAHSWGPWKNHAYIKKYKNSKGKWVYVYASKGTHDMISRESDKTQHWNSILNMDNRDIQKDSDAIKTQSRIADYNSIARDDRMYTRDRRNWLVGQRDKEKKLVKKLASNSDRLMEQNSISGRLKRTAKSTSRKLAKAKKKILGHSSIPEGVVLRQPYENELMHSAGPWKDHKYVSKHKGKNGKWVYVYKLIDAVSSTKGLGLINKIGKGVSKASEDVPKAVSEAKASKPKVETKPKNVQGATYALTDSNIKPKKVKKPTWMKSSKKTTKVAIAHSAKGTSWEKKDHKYVSKEVKNGKTYYKYNPKTKTYQHIQLTKDDLAPQTPSESAKMMVDSSTMGLDKAREKMLAKRGIYTKEALINKSNIDGKLLVSKASGGHARRKSNRR